MAGRMGRTCEGVKGWLNKNGLLVWEVEPPVPL